MARALCIKQNDELPRIKVSLADSLPTQAREVRADNATIEDRAETNSAGHSNLGGMPTVITQSAIDKELGKGGGVELWEPQKWNRLKTLAPAAAGKGTVELMTSEAHCGQTVAVKKLPWELVRSSPKEFNKQHPNVKERPWFDIGVVKHLNKLQFPYTCNFLGVFLGLDHQVYIATSFANRGDLFSWCQNDKTTAGLEREAAMRPIVWQLFSGVCWLHNAGLAHCDLSVENVMLHADRENNLQVKIIDFGMSSLSRMATKCRGKRSYQAPEMHGGAEYDSFRADNFAVGVIVYCMAVHHYPWEQTKPGRDKSCEFVKFHGLGMFLQRKKMPCSRRPVAEVLSMPCLEILWGLLAFDPESRYSLGETCFGKNPLTASLVASNTFQKQTSADASTTDSLSNPRDMPSEGEGSDLDGDVDDERGVQRQANRSVWNTNWFATQDTI